MTSDEQRLQAAVDEATRLLDAPMPDSRVQDLSLRKRTEVVDGAQRYERVYCANCGADGGLVTADWTPHIFYLCNDCVGKHGQVGLTEIPEDLVRGIAKLTDKLLT